MALLSNSSTIQIAQNSNATVPVQQKTEHNAPNPTDHFLFSNLFNALPRWDTIRSSTGPVNVPHNSYIQNENHNEHDFQRNNTLGAIGSVPGNSLLTHHHELLGGIINTPSTSPQTSSSTSSQVIVACGRCDMHASNRCVDCNDILCDECAIQHRQSPYTRDHCLVPMTTLSPIGSSVNISNGTNGSSSDPQCDVHGEVLRYVENIFSFNQFENIPILILDTFVNFAKRLYVKNVHSGIIKIIHVC